MSGFLGNSGPGGDDIIRMLGQFSPAMLGEMQKGLELEGAVTFDPTSASMIPGKINNAGNSMAQVFAKAIENGGDMNKAMTEVLGTTSLVDLTQLTDGRAITVESIDPILVKILDQQNDAILAKDIPTSKISVVVDMYNELSGWGMSGRLTPNGRFTNELDFPAVQDMDIARKVGYAKFLRDQKRLSDVMLHVQTVKGQNPEDLINMALATTIIVSKEWSLLYGDSNMMPDTFDGLIKSIENWDSTYYGDGTDRAAEHLVMDMRDTAGGEGTELTYDDFVDMTNRAARNRGFVSDFYCGYELSNYLDKAIFENSIRLIPGMAGVNLDNLTYGHPVDEFACAMASGGRLRKKPSRYIRHGANKFFDYPPAVGIREGATATNGGPATLTTACINGTAPVLNAPTITGSQFAAGDAGDYWYLIVPINEKGTSERVHATFTGGGTAITVAAGGSVDIVIDHAVYATDAIRGFLVYRSQVGAADESDCRFIGSIWAGADGTGSASPTVTTFSSTATQTTFRDLNQKLPGCAEAFALDLKGDQLNGSSVDFRQLLDFMKVKMPFGFGNQVAWSWLGLYYGYMRMRRGSNIYVKNIKLPEVDATFRP